MADYFDVGFNIHTILKFWNTSYGDEGLQSESKEQTDENKTPRQGISTIPLEVRPSICITGLDNELIVRVKNLLSSLTSKPLPLESFHIKDPHDIEDGALLVPKVGMFDYSRLCITKTSVVLVARHCVGRLLIDEEGDTGQLDFIYDELVEAGTDVMLIYVGLPAAIYPPMKHMIYHPRMIDIVFPTQPILREYAEENCLVTTVANKDFTNMQKNVILEWLQKPVRQTHPVYEHAAHLSRSQSRQSFDDASFWSETEVYQRNWGDNGTGARGENSYVSATEEHPLATKKKKKKSKLFKIKQKLASKTSRNREVEYGRFVEDNRNMMDETVEMEMYRQSGYVPRSMHEFDV